jgi:hypothetical protein
MLSILADGRRVTPFVILSRKNLPKKPPSEITFKCNVQGEELMVKWLTELTDSRLGALLKERGMLVVGAFNGH